MRSSWQSTINDKRDAGEGSSQNPSIKKVQHSEEEVMNLLHGIRLRYAGLCSTVYTSGIVNVNMCFITIRAMNNYIRAITI